MTINLTTLPQWSALQAHHKQVTKLTLREMFRADPERFKHFSLDAAGILLDYSKNRINDETISLLCQLAEAVNLSEKIEHLFAGHEINHTENRAALHVALRQPVDTTLLLNGQNVVPEVHAVLAKMGALADKIHDGSWRGFNQQLITDIVNIGIGGSDLGPAMVTEALTPYATTNIRCHFVANIDASQITKTLQSLNPATTLFIVSSKSFGTLETLTNARTAWQWFCEKAGSVEAAKHHFFAVTEHPAKAMEFGIQASHIFELWGWVGGRYSLWSAIGLPIALSIGMKQFEELLAGAHVMDQHFRHAPFHANMPVIMGLLGIWYINFFGASSQAIIPYLHALRGLPAYLQQADMESNGKHTRQDGSAVNYATGPIIWGGEGCNAQHAFHQLLHQGTHLIPVDFLLAARSHTALENHHAILYAQCLSQSRALMYGKTHEEAMLELQAKGYDEKEARRLTPHNILAGNNPSNTLIFEKLTPYTLGALLALYEHKIFVQGVIWNINSYDQWGVELGKRLVQQILPDIVQSPPQLQHDASTNGLIDYYHEIQKRNEKQTI